MVVADRKESLTSDNGHTLDWKANEDAAMNVGAEIAKAVQAVKAERGDQSDDSGHLTAHQKKNSQARNLEVIQNA